MPPHLPHVGLPLIASLFVALARGREAALKSLRSRGAGA
jgi:hypothetical protein